ncbi:unnamed protein product [Rotaria magnacalcarata]|uniref:G-protein coupled receptors family 1 profile domain-containing protein n=2 Tax=Rotaria magnacalcarata TaxID=392030 RepID=A0A816ASM2_9BILA|nr:unnamed protein product [Rotaria magnacalcarata]CAF2078503.1 unnamed protein product [Rotaria magnacalcarata]CAF2096017.1 unnamed protein product [Rotaria magnacalcarata]CAF3822738.1 unnamed protein product [Rotaria magnacalcarata]CAF4276487.1 unnamed protein product [Rotaria magnacalcarata]
MFIEHFIILASALSICISIGFIVFVICASSLHSMSIALTCHSTVTIIITNIFLLLTAVFMLNTNLQNNLWCQINAYCVQVSLILIYHSYCLEAFHRFAFIVHHNNVYFHGYHIFFAIIICQWIFAWLYPFRLLLLGLFTYDSTIRLCHINWDLSLELFALLAVQYLIPLIIDVLCYVLVIKHAHLHIIEMTLHRTSQKRQPIVVCQEQRRMKREFKMLKRIIIIFLVLFMMNFPSLVLIIIASIDWNASMSIDYTYRIILLNMSCILLLISIFQFILTPTVKTLIHDFWKRRKNQVCG